MRKLLVVSLVCILAMGLACKTKAKPEEPEQTKEPEKESTMTGEATTKFAEPKQAAIDDGKKYTAVIKTSKGEIVCELFAKEAPLSVTNFKQLADGNYYKGLTFHRVVPDFVVQGGDPTGTGAGGPGYTIPAEIKMTHKQGALAWARTGDEVNPERRSSGSQFYITLKPTPFLDGAYTVFGQTIQGMDVVEKITQGDVIEDVIIKVD
ncbi:MAG: peptidylprolyl isomerase [Pseudomonadota bacterium]